MKEKVTWREVAEEIGGALVFIVIVLGLLALKCLLDPV